MTAWVVAAPASGCGKTSLTLGLARACKLRGLQVQCFKVGPDYLDPTYLARASGQPCLNLDSWMSGAPYVRALFEQACSYNDVILIEGVMGLFDGADPTNLDGSTAAIAQLLNVPVLFMVPAGGMARSICATVHGFNTFADGVRIGGVVANHVGSDSHVALLTQALDTERLPPLLGALPKNGIPALPARHLGLLDASEVTEIDFVLDELANAIEKHVNVNALLAKGNDSAKTNDKPSPFRVPRVRVGIACDAAFRFTYPDNLTALENAGVRWVPFSPLRDRVLPPHLDGLYFPGGYPEAHAWTLSANRSFLDSVREALDDGIPTYAECGGLMYLTRGITMQDGVFHSWVGVLPTSVRMLARRKSLGYCEVRTTATSCFGPLGTRLRGHEFHYSELEEEVLPDWNNIYETTTRSGSKPAGYRRGRILASYVHLHWASQTDVCDNFVRYMQGI